MAKKYPKMAQVLKKLLFEKDMKSIDLAREVDLPAPTVHRLVTGKSTRPYKSSIEPIADFFSISTDQLLGEQPLPGEEVVIETEHNELSSDYISRVPLIPWNKINERNTLDFTEYKTVPYIGSISEAGFATIMPDSSMEPIFSRNSILIFDPNKTASDRSYILVKLTEAQQPVFRQLLIDLEHQYLKPLNPDLTAFQMRLLKDEDEILGILIEARQVYNDAT